MKTNKEYPATHSMATAWYCVDEDGNVGIFDIEDNGPVPVGEYVQNDVEEVFWDDFSIDNGEYIKDLMLKPEQIPPLIERLGNYGTWESGNCDWSNADWMYTILKIDMSKLDILKQALSKDRYHDQRPVCISKGQGLFYVDFFYNKEGVELLLENNVILAKYKVPHYSTQWSKDREEEGARQRNAFPLFIYHQDYVLNDLPAMRLTNPPSPLKIEQLPKEIQAKIHKLPLKFKETERIQLAELMPVEHIWSMDYVYDGKIWWELASSDDSLIYYNEESNTIITKERMDILIANGEAEEFNWDKHRHIKEER